MLQPGAGCGGQGTVPQARTPTTSGDAAGSLLPPGLVASDASQTLPSTADLNMLLKLIAVYLPSGLPKLEMGELATRPLRLISWKQQIVTALNPVGSLALHWWQWVIQAAERAHVRFVAAHIQDRESVVPTDVMPGKYSEVDAWLKPKLMEAIPAQTRSIIDSRARIGCVEGTHLVMFWVLK